MAGVLIIIVLVLMLFLINTRSEPDEDCSPAAENSSPPEIPSGKPHNTAWEKNHFITKHLHRDDAKHERHRRNQFPQ